MSTTLINLVKTEKMMYESIRASLLNGEVDQAMWKLNATIERFEKIIKGVEEES